MNLENSPSYFSSPNKNLPESLSSLFTLIAGFIIFLTISSLPNVSKMYTGFTLVQICDENFHIISLLSFLMKAPSRKYNSVSVFNFN